jgi:hypothetical protein
MCSRFIHLIPLEGFSSNLAQILALTRQCVHPIHSLAKLAKGQSFYVCSVNLIPVKVLSTNWIWCSTQQGCVQNTCCHCAGLRSVTLKVKYQTILCPLLRHFPLNLAQMFTSTRQCDKPIWTFCVCTINSYFSSDILTFQVTCFKLNKLIQM